MAKKKSTTRKKAPYGGAIGRSAAAVGPAANRKFRASLILPPRPTYNPAKVRKAAAEQEAVRQRMGRSTGGVMKSTKPN